MEPLSANWYILEDPLAPGEHVVLESLGQKLGVIWLSRAEALAFSQNSPAAAGMAVAKLDTWVLKEAFLRAVGHLGVDRLLVGYQPGQPSAQMLESHKALSFFLEQSRQEHS